MQRKAFTLIELLIVVSIMALLFSAGVASFRSFSRGRKLAAVKEQVLSDLRFAQELSLSGTKPAGCTGDLIGYQFSRFDQDTYKIIASCTTGSPVERKMVDLDTGFTLGHFSPLTFEVLGNGVIEGDVNITITQTNTGLSESILVTSSGEIR